VRTGISLTTILINLAVGLALSAISFLLTPKPKQPGQTSSRQLASVTGADRFSVTSGFDTQAELANYGDPIPIIFGQYTGETGGILAAPDRKDQRLLERVKIAGDYDLFATAGPKSNIAVRKQGQKGTGRGYGRRMGITSLNGQPVTAGETEVREVAVGNTAIFTIASGKLPDNLYYRIYPDGTVIEGTKVDDINSEITAGRRGADELLQLGETVMIGRTVWVVESRSLPEWEEEQRQLIGLRCIETFGGGLGASIGLVSERMITRGVYGDDNGTTNARQGLGLHAGAGFYPLLRVAFGVVRNSRDCEVTEIGIRSQVWNRANGLCNFQGLPAVDAFRGAEIDGVGIDSGVMTLYIKRTSVWTIWLRPSGTDDTGAEYNWKPLGEQFCVTGETPQDQFNFIRITHPNRGRYEFKMVPKSGADVRRP
jgi:hypothetical protein